MRSKINERIPVSQVEALVLASKHGNTTGRKAIFKDKKGKITIYSRKKEVCAICQVVTMYLTTHLHRVHELSKGTQEYKDAIDNSRLYLGRKKELSRIKKATNRKKRRPRKEVCVAMKIYCKPRKKHLLNYWQKNLKFPTGGTGGIWRGDLPTPPEFHNEDQAFTSKTQEQVGDISRDDQVEEPDETEGSEEERECKIRNERS